MHPSASWRWFEYYWNFCKYLGLETYQTWRWELFSSVPVGFFVAFLSGKWDDFRTIITATGLTLGCFIVWHLIRLPWILHRASHGTRDTEPGVLLGMLGVLAIAGVFVGGWKFGTAVWASKPISELKMEFPLNRQPIEISKHVGTASKQKECPPSVQPSSIQQPPNQACPSNVPPQVPGMLEGRLPSPMFLSTKYLAARNIVLAVDGFLSLPEMRTADSQKCSLKITAPKENESIASALNDVAGVCGCRVDLSVGDDLQPEIEEVALNGATPNFVTIHAPKDKRYERFIGRLGGFFHLKRKYDAPNEGKPNQMIWIQIGPGSPWQEKNTYGYSIGGGV